MTKINQLIPNTDFGKTLSGYSDAGYRRIRDNYDAFISQLLSDRYEVNGVSAHPLNRFVPCDLDGNVLEEYNEKPVREHYWNEEEQVCNLELYQHNIKEYRAYQQAKYRVLFEGFVYDEVLKRVSSSDNSFEADKPILETTKRTIESITEYKLPLTPTAKTMIYGNS